MTDTLPPADPSPTRMPALFIGHGSPTNTFEDNRFTAGWRALGEDLRARLPRPRALLVVSAHWYFGATAVTAMARPRTIHDFYGFPQKLFDFQYPAPGAPDVASEIVEAAKPMWVGLDHDQWGFDHGAWSVLAHLWPDADVPVVQLSISALRPLEYHLQLAARLAPLRDKGIMIIGSGNVVHNLAELRRDLPDRGFAWAERFDDAASRQLADAPADLLKLCEHGDYAQAVPTPEHFIPLVYLAGLAAAGGTQPQSFLRGFAMGSLSMTCHRIG